MTPRISLAPPTTTLPLPPLESGDRLSRPEFERRYAADPQVKKAELIEGIVYVASPLRFQHHARPHSRLHGWLWTYQIATPKLQLGIEPTVRLDLDNEVQPDIVLLIEPDAGGQTQLSAEDYIEGAPELVVEIAASSAAIDLGRKQQVYRRSGVKEYLVWQSFEQRLDWFTLVDGNYERLQPDSEGMLKSQAFPGLWLNLNALAQGLMPQVLQGLQQGMATPE
ncbi:MAG: Uma2 family endonuclease [Spirulina sp. SIO3F2]|nr:Uma2 family endonuclease [Spirulina sp. SIO3F2]